MIPGWTREKLDRLIQKVKEVWTSPKDKGFWENLYCLGPGEHVIITSENLYAAESKDGNVHVATLDNFENKARMIISQKMAYYGKKHGKKYAVRKVAGGVKIWRME